MGNCVSKKDEAGEDIEQRKPPGGPHNAAQAMGQWQQFAAEQQQIAKMRSMESEAQQPGPGGEPMEAIPPPEMMPEGYNSDGMQEQMAQ